MKTKHIIKFCKQSSLKIEFGQRQLTRDQAIRYAQSGAWGKLTFERLFVLGMNQARLLCPFSTLHQAAERALGRPVYSHEFSKPERLVGEYLDRKQGYKRLEDPTSRMRNVLSSLPGMLSIVRITNA